MSQFKERINTHIEEVHANEYRSRYFYSSRKQRRNQIEVTKTLHSNGKKSFANKSLSKTTSVAEQTNSLHEETNKDTHACNECKNVFHHRDQFDLHMEYYHARKQPVY